ncbi:hypothetical protein LJR219_004626 [Phenylobacterium sp. LjRoot219]|uniref:hypothetical protein n=1 Tax=Phenylobacterium sp. LjRoot219 TaxID=3342283 RepID=UPI003ECCC0ED
MASRIVLVVVGAALGLAGCGEKPAQGGAPGPVAAAPTALDTAQARDVRAAQTETVIARGMTSHGTAEAQVVEAVRQNGILTVKIRFGPVRAPGGATDFHTLYPNPKKAQQEIAVVAGDRKYFLLTDADGMPLTPPDMMVKVTQDAPLAGTWWGKFPAPPAEIKTISLTLPEVEAIENIPLSDR